MEKINAAVIGVGSMGKNHARVYAHLDNINLVAVADTNGEAAKRIAKRYGCASYTNYKEMLENEDADIVSVAVPTKMHKEVSIEAMERGTNVLVEKPIASSVEDGKEIVEQAKKKKVKLMVGHIERFNPAIVELKKRIENNELGKVFKIDINRVGPFPKRVRDVGVVIDLAVHDLDIIRYLTNSEVKRIHTEIERQIHTKHEDLLSAILRLENGVICNLNVNWLTPTKIRKLYITGEKGMFFANYLTQDLYFYENAEISNNVDYRDVMMGVSEGKMTRFNFEKKEPLMVEIEHFVDCVLNGKKPLITEEDSLKALELAHKLIGQ
jgi:predicted dehydrogenase